jgi:hypothetical protein
VIADNRKAINDAGGSFMAEAIAQATPRGERVHYRYNTAKVNRGMRAPKGMGTVVATYQPGNLQKSMQVLKLNRAKTKTYVGARLAKGKATGNFGAGARTDGFYAHMVDGGTKHTSAQNYYRPAVLRATPTVLNILLKKWQRLGATTEAYLSI